MNLKILIFLFALVALSCEKPNPELQKDNLAGYWEIKTVTLKNGASKDYSVNMVIDYIEVKGDSGFRTKVSPKIDGSFTTNGTAESFKLKVENDSLRMYYKTTFDTWKETVISAKDSTLVIKNEDDKIYTYRKFKQFEFTK